MKKILLSMLVAGLTIPAVAQEKAFTFADSETMVSHEVSDSGISSSGMLPVNPASLTEVQWRGYAGVSQSYDRQSQGSVYPMTQMHDDGFIGCTWTNEDNSAFPGSSTPNRGVGYSYSTDGGQTWSWKLSDPETQENRVGGIPLYWPSYAQWGANGEAILARNPDSYMHNGVQLLDGLVLMTRENKGQGAWTITTVPYPAGTSPDAGYTMAWARMTTSGANHQYIHIMSPMSTPTTQPYQGYTIPVFYYRTQDGGSTWDIEGQLVPEMLGEQWDSQSNYTDAISFAVQGNTVACSFIRFGQQGYVLKSLDNGTTWESIKFFDTPVGYYNTPSEYADTVYTPSQGCIALDNNGKIHVVFSVIRARNSATSGYLSYFIGMFSSFLTYWNEDMEPIDGDNDFVNYEIEPLVENYFDWDLWNEYYYVISTYPKWPIIGYFTPVLDEHYYMMLEDFFGWATASYNLAGCFSFPQMAFDAENGLHLTYLGLLDGGYDGFDYWLRHPFYTVTYDGGQSWTKTKYLVSNNLGLIDQEFAYLTLAGFGENKMYMMAQTDYIAGTHIAGDHNPTNNFFQFFSIGGVPEPPPPPPPACNSVTDVTANIDPDCKSATITWTAVDGAKEYEIRRNSTLLGRVSTPSYTDNFNFVNGTTYKWKIKTICDEKASRVASVSVTANCEVCDPVTNAKAEIEDCETATITWTAAAGAKEYEIRRDGALLGTVTTPEFTEIAEFEHKKSYTWTIKAICNLSESTERSVSATAECESGISELANSVFIYPNPSNTSVTIDAKDFAKVEIFNTVGQLIESTTANIVDVSSYNTGIYFFKVYDVNNNSVTKRVMVK